MAKAEISDLKALYASIVNREKNGKVIELFENFLKETHPYPLTPRHDSILHIAIYTGRESLVREILTKFCNLQADLLSARNKAGDTILHAAAETNMTCLVDYLLRLAPDLLLDTNDHEETPLFRAAHYGQTKMFRLLADQMERKGEAVEAFQCHLKRKDKTTILHMAVLAEFFDLALEIARKYECLASSEDGSGMIALQLLSSIPSAFKSGSNYGLLKRFIYYCVPSEDIKKEEDSNRGDSTHESDQGSKLPPNYDVCVEFYSMVVRRLISEWPMMERIYKDKRKHESAFKLASFLIQQDFSWTQSSGREDEGKISLGFRSDEGGHGSKDPDPDLGKISPGLHSDEGGHGSQPGEIAGPPKTTDQGTSSSRSTGGSKEGGVGGGKEGTTPGKKTRPLTPLLLATSTGIVEIVKEILRVHPQAVEHVSYEGQNILHVAIKHRQLDIFRRVKKMDIPMNMLVRRFDSNGYTILHHVAHKQGYAGGRTQPGPAFQLQEELRWLERVRKIMPDHYQMHRIKVEEETGDNLKKKTHNEEFLKEVQEWLMMRKIIPRHDYEMHRDNENGETADELFEKTHEELLKEAQEWLMRTSESCSTVSVLIATVAFAAAYTVPGGSNQETGVPILLHDPFFLVFTVMDVLSLASSLTSVVMFLSILTSPFELQDFRRSLPRKLTLGFTFLFLSVAVTMLAFAATIVLVIHLKKRWTTTLLYTAAFLPVTVFALLQFPLYVAFMSTWKFSLRLIRNVLPKCLLPPRVRTPSINYKTL